MKERDPEFGYDKRAITTRELSARLLDALAAICESEQPDMELHAKGVKAAAELAYYLHSAPGIDEAARTLYMGMLSAVHARYVTTREVVEVPCDHPCDEMRARCSTVVDCDGRVWDDTIESEEEGS